MKHRTQFSFYVLLAVLLFSNTTQAADYVVDEPFPQEVVTKYTERNGLPEDGEIVLAACGHTLFAGTSRGLLRLHESIWHPAYRREIPAPVTVLHCRDNVILAGGAKGLVSVDLNTGYIRTMLPEPVFSAASARGHVFAGAQSGLLHITPDGGIFTIDETQPVTVMETGADNLFFMTDNRLFAFNIQKGKTREIALPADLPGLQVRDLRVDMGRVFAATNKGVGVYEVKTRKWKIYRGEIGGLPYEDVTAVAAHGDILMVGFTMGGARFNGSEWHYMESGRYFSDNHIFDVVLSRDGAAWFATPGGITELVYKNMTLAEKAAYYQELVPLFIRHGFVGDAPLSVQGQMDSLYVKTHDNENVWTGMFVAAECFRYKVTGDAQALETARNSINALLRLETIAGGNGYFARSFARTDEDRGGGGEWHPAGDGEWWWKGDTSSDELAGRFFGFSVYHDLCASPDEKKTIADNAARTMRHIIENDYYLIDVDGEPTTWGRWNPDFFKTDGKFQKNLNSLEILSFLRTAYEFTGDPLFYDEYKKLIMEYGYAHNTKRSKINQPGIMNHSDDLLHFLSYYPLLKYEDVDKLLDDYYLPSIRRTWGIVEKEKNPLWNFIYAAVTPGVQEYDPEGGAWLLRRMPLEVIYWPVKNSHRMDIEFNPYDGPRQDEKQSLKVLPPDERFMLKFNENPFRLDGYWNGYNAECPSFWLLPYWMGRYYGFIREPEQVK